MIKLKQKVKDKLGEQKVAKLKKTWRVVRIIKNIVCWTLIAVLTLAIIVFTLTKINGDSPTLFGYSLHRIMSGSMEPEIETNDVILNKEVSDASEVKLGDIVTFEGGPSFDNKNVTHRVIVAPYDNGKGRIVLVTKGDANEMEDFSNTRYRDLIGVVKYHFPYLGSYLMIYSNQITKVYLMVLAFCGVMFNILAGRMRRQAEEKFREQVERWERRQAARSRAELEQIRKQSL